MPRISKAFIAPLLCGLLVTACGGSTGGGTGAPTSAAATTFPLSTALANLYANGFQKTVSVTGTAQSSTNATQFPFTASLNVTETPANAGFIFENEAARRQTSSFSGVFNINGINGNFSSVAQNFLSANNMLLGLSANSYCVANTPGQFPESIVIGQAQSVVTYDCYKDSTKVLPIGTAKVSFLVGTGDSPSTATFSTIEIFVDPTGLQTQFTQKNFLVDTSGNISFQSLSFLGLLTPNNDSTSNGIQFSFKSQ